AVAAVALAAEPALVTDHQLPVERRRIDAPLGGPGVRLQRILLHGQEQQDGEQRQLHEASSVSRRGSGLPGLNGSKNCPTRGPGDIVLCIWVESGRSTPKRAPGRPSPPPSGPWCSMRAPPRNRSAVPRSRNSSPSTGARSTSSSAGATATARPRRTS